MVFQTGIRPHCPARGQLPRRRRDLLQQQFIGHLPVEQPPVLLPPPLNELKKPCLVRRKIQNILLPVVVDSTGCERRR